MYRAYRTDSGTTTTKWMGAFSNPTWIRLDNNGKIVECAEKDATGVRLIGCSTLSWDGVYSLVGSEQAEALQAIDDYKGEVAMTNIGTGTAEVITEANFSSRNMTDSMLATADRIPITDVSARSSGYVTLRGLSSFVRTQLGGGLAPYILVTGLPEYAKVVAINGDISIDAGEPYLNSNSNNEWYVSLPSYGRWTVKVTDSYGSICAKRIQLDNDTRYDSVYFYNEWLPEMNREGGLNAYTWDEINKISASGLASTYFNVGDTHAITLNGTVGTLELDTTLYAYILDFDHDKSTAANAADGITFGTFKTAASGGVDVALVDSQYGPYASNDGTKYFNMNHWGNYNYGGWAGCDLRYDILGSTDQAPSGYGEAVKEGRTGYDASSTTATNPVLDTLMAALPADLRAVMKPMYIMSDNIGGATGNNPIYMTPSIDYLPLLDEYDIFGTNSYASYHSDTFSRIYAYYANGNSKKKYNYSKTTFNVYYGERSPCCSSTNAFCCVGSDASASSISAAGSVGVAPVFKV